MPDDAGLALVERLRLKLLAASAQSATSALREALCPEPDRELVRRLAREARDLLDEYLDDGGDG